MDRPSLNHVTFGGGWPRTLHTILSRLPSFTVVLFAVSDSIVARCPAKIEKNGNGISELHIKSFAPLEKAFRHWRENGRERNAQIIHSTHADYYYEVVAWRGGDSVPQRQRHRRRRKNFNKKKTFDLAIDVGVARMCNVSACRRVFCFHFHLFWKL